MFPQSSVYVVFDRVSQTGQRIDDLIDSVGTRNSRVPERPTLGTPTKMTLLSAASRIMAALSTASAKLRRVSAELGSALVMNLYRWPMAAGWFTVRRVHVCHLGCLGVGDWREGRVLTERTSQPFSAFRSLASFSVRVNRP